jgi:Family of unknown function (DUF5906)
MNETARALGAKEVIELIGSHLDAYQKGGPDRKEEDIELARSVGLKVVGIAARWDDAREERKEKEEARPQRATEVGMESKRPAGASVGKEQGVGPSASTAVSFRRNFAAAHERLAKKEEAPPFLVQLQPSVAEPDAAGLAAALDDALAKQKASPEPEPQPKTSPEPSKALTVVKETLPPLLTVDPAIAAMNEHHAIIDNVGGKTVIACWEPSPLDPSKLMVIFQDKSSFLLRYSNKKMLVDFPNGPMSVRIGEHWLGHRHRRQYRGVTFLPAGPGLINECLNLWRGWGCDAKPGDWGLIRRHIEEVVASGNEEFADYIMRWIAWSIQHPDQQAEVALVLIGAKGAGKGTLARCLQPIFGAHAFQVTSREEVIGKFNGHLQDCILFIADEAYWGGDKRCVGRLQGMITETTLPIERKGIDVFQVRNFLHVVMLAEPGWVIPAGRHERRYAAFAVSTKKLGDRATSQRCIGRCHRVASRRCSTTCGRWT